MPQKAQISPSPTAIEPQSVQIIFSGDFMQHLPQVNAATTKDGFSYYEQLKYISKAWHRAPYSVINLETTLSDTPPYTGYPLFCSPDIIAQTLKDNGITHIALANNHAMDRGLIGVQKTAEALQNAQLEYFGVGIHEDRALCFINHFALKVALLNATYGTNGMPVPKGVERISELDTTALLKQINRAKDSLSTHIIAFLHWGNEYETTPHSTQKKLALWLRSKGVNLIVGSHPHVAQPIDKENSIIYSLGNFTSNQRKIDTDAGYSVRITLHQNNPTAYIEPLPHYVDISEDGLEKYRVLTLSDTTLVKNSIEKQRMIKAIKRVEKIIDTPVKYD